MRLSKSLHPKGPDTARQQSAVRQSWGPWWASAALLCVKEQYNSQPSSPPVLWGLSGVSAPLINFSGHSLLISCVILLTNSCIMGNIFEWVPFLFVLCTTLWAMQYTFLLLMYNTAIHQWKQDKRRLCTVNFDIFNISKNFNFKCCIVSNWTCFSCPFACDIVLNHHDLDD